jgi:hypothetical protein
MENKIPILPTELTNIVLKYTKPSIKVEFYQVHYFNQSEFNIFAIKDITKLDIHGILLSINFPVGFINSEIETSKGSVGIIGYTSIIVI